MTQPGVRLSQEEKKKTNKEDKKRTNRVRRHPARRAAVSILGVLIGLGLIYVIYSRSPQRKNRDLRKLDVLSEDDEEPGSTIPEQQLEYERWAAQQGDPEQHLRSQIELLRKEIAIEDGVHENTDILKGAVHTATRPEAEQHSHSGPGAAVPAGAGEAHGKAGSTQGKAPAERTTVVLVAHDELGVPFKVDKLCPVDCRVSTNRAHIPFAHGVIFNAPHNAELPAEKTPGQVWIGMCMEPMRSEACAKMHTAFDGHVDWTVSYLPSADVPAYFHVPTPIEMRKEVPEKNQPEPAALLFSTCHRTEEQRKYLHELLAFMPVASYGKCLHNKELPTTPLKVVAPADPINVHAEYSPSMTPEVYQTIGQHKFYLAFERHDDPYYHTDKFWAGYVAGAVPVYWGSATIKTGNFGPLKNSFISVQDFLQPRALAEYLLAIDKDPALYEHFFEWKTQPLSKQYFHHKANDISNLACNICRKIVNLGNGSKTTADT